MRAQNKILKISINARFLSLRKSFAPGLNKQKESVYFHYWQEELLDKLKRILFFAIR